MYRQFLVRKKDRKFQRILWKDADGNDQAYELNTVTFGLSSAPYLAIRCLHQLADDFAEAFPIAARVLKDDMYVDDALTGAQTVEEALQLRNQLTQLLQNGGLNMRQWASNVPELFSDLPLSSVNLQLQTDKTTTIKTLGVHWNSNKDEIVYTVRLDASNQRITKRHILSETARIFDPLGLLAPVIVTAKILMQKLWALHLDWDESLPERLHEEWKQYYHQLRLLNELSFARRAVVPNAQRIEIHGFCDASEKAYAACLYLRTKDSNGTIQIELLTAKSRVAPLKAVSIPRLELCGAMLLTGLYTTVTRALPCNIDDTYFWTDSTIVLHWIRTPSQRLKTFVANRVAEIQSKTDVTKWLHVRTQDNPADLLSRGQTPEDFVKPSIWTSGPSWLPNQDEWPQDNFTVLTDLPEMKKETCLVVTETSLNDDFCTKLFNRFSSFDKLQRIVAYCLRFRQARSTKGHLTVTELRHAHQRIIKLLQQIEFSTVIDALKRGKELQTRNKLLRLNPFIDRQGLLRVGGRLANATIPFEQQHPIILPKDHCITILLIRREHEMQGHAGTQATLYAVRRRYWPIDGRSQVWKVLKGCIQCCKVKPPPVQYIMGNLPTPRVTASRPFSHVGIDYCGPFLLKERKYRNRGKMKVYVAVFVCLAVKAVHLELVSDLTTDGFIAALRRFISRRGHCTHIYSDNGTNFVGANNDLRDLLAMLKTTDTQHKVQDFLHAKMIEWHFTPPRSPHFGGLWEAAVKSFKTHLVKVAGIELLFTFEEFTTLITEIEAILNSRPLTPISNDPEDLTVLTPGHFLIGESPTSLREHNYRYVPVNRLSTWQHLQKIKEDFWFRWKREYLNELMSRNKWAKGEHAIRVNSIVLMRDDNLPSLHWPLGRVTHIYPGEDGVVRTVTVRTSKGVYKRAIKGVVPLPIETSPPEDCHETLDDH